MGGTDLVVWCVESCVTGLPPRGCALYAGHFVMSVISAPAMVPLEASQEHSEVK